MANQEKDLDEQSKKDGTSNPHEKVGKDKKNTNKDASHDEGQYQEGKDKPTMSPGSSEAEVNPSAKPKR